MNFNILFLPFGPVARPGASPLDRRTMIPVLSWGLLFDTIVFLIAQVYFSDVN
jgi:hypothetical protein